MKKTNLIVVLLWLLALPFANAQTINAENSKVNFRIGNMKFNTVKGTFQGMKGNVDFDTENLDQSKFAVCIEVATVNTGSKKRDEHLLKDDFFSAQEHPTICFESNALEKTAEGYLAKGNLTIRGITKTVSIPFSLVGKQFSGSLEVSRYDFNVGTDTGTFLVAENVEIEIVCVLE